MNAGKIASEIGAGTETGTGRKSETEGTGAGAKTGKRTKKKQNLTFLKRAKNLKWRIRKLHIKGKIWNLLVASSG